MLIDLLVLYKYKNDKDINKVGISVSKKVGNSVVRSRVQDSYMKAID